MSDPTPGVIEWMTRARHIVYGTATVLVESLQDSDKRAENLNKLSFDLDQLATDLATKGEQTEKEALQYFDQQKSAAQNSAHPSTDPVDPEAETDPSTSTPTTSTQVTSDEIADLMDLTRQIEALRLDLERRRTDVSDVDP